VAAWATLGEKGLGEPPPDSLRRVRLAWARLPGLALDSPAADTIFQTLQSNKIFHTPQIAIYPYKYPAGSNRSKATQKQIKDNSNSKP